MATLPGIETVSYCFAKVTVQKAFEAEKLHQRLISVDATVLWLQCNVQFF